ncbi:MAG: ribosome-associated translation inhibitor RaiA [Deltaproteobacteria bacterium]|nr:ribosome-associated translation inhibitor RaiA [Deltaproteobacteria bacterium]
MQLSITFKNIETSENIKTHIAEKIEKLDKLLDNPGEAAAVLSVEKFRNIAEISITGDRLVLNAKEETSDIYSSIDAAIDKLEKQIKKNKEKIRTKRIKNKEKWLSQPENIVKQDKSEQEIKVKNIDYKPMYPEEAVMQFDIEGGNFLVFTNAKTGRVNVVYHRNDGHYGLIQPKI